MVHLAHRPRIRGVKRLPRDEVHVGILFSLHLCARAVLAKIVLLTEGEASACQLIVAQLEIRQVPGHDWRLRARAPRPLCSLGVGAALQFMLGLATFVFALFFGSASRCVYVREKAR